MSDYAYHGATRERGETEASSAAAMTLAESLIHELIDTSVLKLSRAIEIVQSAVDVQTAIEVDRYGASASEPRAVRPLSAILLSLQIDHNRAGALSAT